MSIKIHFYFLLFIPFFISCQSSATEEKKLTDKINEIPTLINRNEAIWHGAEWSDIQNVYGNNREKVLRDENDYEARLKLAEVFINEARISGEHGHYYPAALKMLDKILSAEKLNKDMAFRALSTKAGVLLSLHRFSEALSTGEKALGLNPHNAQIYGVLTDAYVEMGEYKKAVNAADKMVSIRPDLRSYSRISYLREIHGDVEGAKEAMQMAVRAGHPTLEETAWAMLTLGELYMNYGSSGMAENVFQKILAHRPNHPFAIGALADILIKKEKYTEAEKLLNKAKSIIPEVGFYIKLTKIYQSSGKIDIAQNMCNEILLMLNDDINSGHNMNLELAGVYSELMDDDKKALEYLLAEYNIRPKNIDVNRQLAQIYSNMKNLEKTKTHLDIAAKTQSKHPDLLALDLSLEKG